MKINKKTIGGAILALLLLLIFFSKTIYTYNLPLVTATKPTNGKLSKLEMSSGIAAWDEIENLYAAVGGVVGEVFVKEGETVTAGQKLLRMEFDREDAIGKLKEIEGSRKRVNIDIKNINLRMEKLNRTIEELKNDSDFSSNYDMESLERDIAKAQDALRDAEELYELGEISGKELDDAQQNLDSLLSKRTNTKKTLEKSLEDYLADKAAIDLELQAKNVELNNLDLQEEPYLRALEEYDEYEVITAPIDGEILSFSAEKGARINENALITSIGSGDTFVVECAIPLENNFVIQGDECELSNSSRVITGSVSKITPSERSKTVSITISSEEVTAGETFDIVFQKDSEASFTLVPNGAVHQDSDGYFLYQIKRRDGIMGKEFYLERLDVYVGDADSDNTVIVRGITFFEPIALISDKAVETGDVISLANEGDFFEK